MSLVTSPLLAEGPSQAEKPGKPSKPAKAGSLAPKEHGAYGQLALPLVAALASVRPGLASLLAAGAAVAAFVAHEPLLVVLGHRGPRAQRELGERARSRLMVLVPLGLSAFAGALVAGGPSARLAFVPPALLGLAFVPLVLRDQEKTLGGELLAAAALTATGLPVALLGGGALSASLGAWGAWALGFGASTVAVRATIAAHKSPRAARAGGSPLGWWMLGLFTAATLGLGFALEPRVLTALPLVALSWAVMGTRPHPRHLKKLGWSIVAASLVTLACLVVARG
jgi:hypothetical protein